MPDLEERAPQLTRTDPSQTAQPRQPYAPAGPKRNHKGQAEPAAEPERSRKSAKRGAEPDTAAQATEQENTEQPADAPDSSATNGGPPRTHRRTGQAR